ncbi:GIY-YIG nuclease family protein [Candidatus Altiarchaeota archaeon]
MSIGCKMTHYVYILRCNWGELYVGYTTDLKRRFQEHQKGIGCKYTRGRRPVRMVYSKGYQDRGSAMKREAELKQLTKEEKLQLVKNQHYSKLYDLIMMV